MMAVSHLAPDGDGWVFLLSSNAPLLALRALSIAACSGVRPAQITVAQRGERVHKECSF